MSFRDRFSGHAAEYALYRPHYPKELFQYLASLAPNRDAAWDCATGNGQAAEMLAEFFAQVIATDASEKQIANAKAHPRVKYQVAPAEASGLANESVSLIMVAQALHWFDLEKFFVEARRVLRPGGILAASSYNLFRVGPEIDRLVDEFYRQIVRPYWDLERTLVETGYRTISFPFREIEAPIFAMTAEWSLDHALNYLRTWSATRAFMVARGFDPGNSLGQELKKFWHGSRRVDWPLSLIVRRKEEAG